MKIDNYELLLKALGLYDKISDNNENAKEKEAWQNEFLIKSGIFKKILLLHFPTLVSLNGNNLGQLSDYSTNTEYVAMVDTCDWSTKYDSSSYVESFIDLEPKINLFDFVEKDFLSSLHLYYISKSTSDNYEITNLNLGFLTIKNGILIAEKYENGKFQINLYDNEAVKCIINSPLADECREYDTTHAFELVDIVPEQLIADITFDIPFTNPNNQNYDFFEEYQTKLYSAINELSTPKKGHSR